MEGQLGTRLGKSLEAVDVVLGILEAGVGAALEADL